MAFGFVIDRMALWFRYELQREESISLILGTAAIAIGAAFQVIGAVRFVAMRRALITGRSYVQGVTLPIAAVMLVALLGAVLLLFLVMA